MSNITVTVDYDEYRDRLRELMEEYKSHDENPAHGGWAYDRGCETIFYEACALLCRLANEQLIAEAERKAAEREASV